MWERNRIITCRLDYPTYRWDLLSSYPKQYRIFVLGITSKDGKFTSSFLVKWQRQQTKSVQEARRAGESGESRWRPTSLDGGEEVSLLVGGEEFGAEPQPPDPRHRLPPPPLPAPAGGRVRFAVRRFTEGLHKRRAEVGRIAVAGHGGFVGGVNPAPAVQNDDAYRVRFGTSSLSPNVPFFIF
jgi:hypothetical protein